MTRPSAVLCVLALYGHLAAQTCDSHLARLGDSTIDLAPPHGYVEVCSLDSQLCSVLTAGFPPSVRTVGYFAATSDWDAYREHSTTGFNQYLIAQLALSMTSDHLPGFKAYLHSQQGSIPDHTQLPRTLAEQGRVPLGILDESQNSITFGIIMTVRSQIKSRPDSTVMVATNTAAAIKNRVLSLYVYRVYHTDADVDSAKTVTKTWLQCLGRAN